MPAEAKHSEPGAGRAWPFFVIYAFMWAGMIGTTLNADPIKPGVSLATIVMVPLLLGVLILLAWARWRATSVFTHEFPTLLGNFAWHVFVLTGIIFLSYLLFDAAIHLMIAPLGLAVFEQGCNVSERDTALFVWDAMAKGAFKFIARYLHISPAACAPNTSSVAVAVATQVIRWYTALVVVWHVVRFGVTWAKRMRAAE